jgi:hypothetical protein
MRDKSRYVSSIGIEVLVALTCYPSRYQAMRHQ